LAYPRGRPTDGTGMEANREELSYGSRGEPLHLPSFPRKRESMTPPVMERQAAVNILVSRRNGTLRVGLTGDLPQRIWQHMSDLATRLSETLDSRLRGNNEVKPGLEAEADRTGKSGVELGYGS